MKILTEIAEIHKTVDDYRKSGKTIGFVPTMGALHEGHLSLIRCARKECDVVVVSIYVNPTQFAPSEDFNVYPRPFEKDVQLCREEGVDLILHLKDEQMYPEDYHTYVNVEFLTENLCGASRPHFFRGVATIVTKLFNLAKPHKAYFGQKDAQQAAVIKRMVADLNFDMQIVVCPIVREPDGLAMSSRNAYLSAEERKQALVLHKGLQKALAAYEAGERDAQALKKIVSQEISSAPLARIDYVECVSAATMHPIDRVDDKAMLAVAVFFGKTRLIDNQMLPDGVFV